MERAGLAPEFPTAALGQLASGHHFWGFLPRLSLPETQSPWDETQVLNWALGILLGLSLNMALSWHVYKYSVV